MKTIGKLYQVKGLVPLSTSSMYRLISKGEFPKQIKLGDRSSGWILEEVEQWLEDRINNRKEDA